MAVPLHGDHRARHVLSPVVRAPRRARAVGRAAGPAARRVVGRVALGTIAALGLGACGAGTAPADVAGPTDASGGTDGAGLRATLAASLAAGGPDAPGGPSTGSRTGQPTGPPRWPADFATHPDAPLEAREWLAVLRDGDGTVWGLRQRLVRVRVPGAREAAPGGDGDDGDGAGSPWRYAAVLRADGALERADGQPLTWSATEREAVGLAGPVADADAATGVEVGVGTGDGTAVGAGLEVLGHAVASAGALPATGCDVAWTLVVPERARLTGTAAGCPVGGRVAGTAAATLGPFPVTGTLRRGPDEGGGDGGADEVTGVAWQRLAWGAVPALGGGAVVFDRAVLALEGVGGVELVRSRRASGRGVPRTTLAPLDARARRAGALDSLAVEWSVPAAESASRPGTGTGTGPDDGDDGGGVSAGSDARDAGRLHVPALGIDVRLRALSPVVATDDGLERAFRGGVVAEGTHRGVGFVEHRPLAPAAGGAATGDGAEEGART